MQYTDPNVVLKTMNEHPILEQYPRYTKEADFTESITSGLDNNHVLIFYTRWDAKNLAKRGYYAILDHKEENGAT